MIEFQRILNLPCWVGLVGKVRLNVTFFNKPTRILGRAWLLESRIKINVHPGSRFSRVRSTIVHELAHLATWAKYGEKAKAHGPEFKAIYAQGVREAFYVVVPSHTSCQKTAEALAIALELGMKVAELPATKMPEQTKSYHRERWAARTPEQIERDRQYRKDRNARIAAERSRDRYSY